MRISIAGSMETEMEEFKLVKTRKHDFGNQGISGLKFFWKFCDFSRKKQNYVISI